MTVQLDHTIVHARDRETSASFLAEILGLGPPEPFGPFLTVATDNGVTLDFASHGGEVVPQHYAFLVSETEFDEIFARIRGRGLTYWADPGRRQAGRINTHHGRGLYFEDPDGHMLEILTRPYGSA